MIQHTIEFTEGSYRLVIWEPAPKTTTRVSPFFFRVTYWLSSPSHATEILKMVKGEHEIPFSHTKYKGIREQTQQDCCKSPPDRLPVAF